MYLLGLEGAHAPAPMDGAWAPPRGNQTGRGRRPRVLPGSRRAVPLLRWWWFKRRASRPVAPVLSCSPNAVRGRLTRTTAGWPAAGAGRPSGPTTAITSACSSTSCGRRRGTQSSGATHVSGYWRPRRQDRLEEQRAILQSLAEANAEDQARIAQDGPALQETAQLLADTEVALQEAREEYKRRTQATPASAPATAPDGPPEATQTDRRDRDRDPSRDRSRSRERLGRPRRRG